MTETKKLYLDGEYVGEYVPSGDLEKEREAAIALLREKGLYQVTTPEQAIFRQALSFATTASYLYQRDLTVVPRNGMSVAPFVVNATFALELYLKTLGLLHNTVLRGHDLLSLFDALPPVAHQALLQNFVKSTWQCDITEMVAFRKEIERLRSAFLEWRYLHERKRASEIRFVQMIFVMEVLDITCRSHDKLATPPRVTPAGIISESGL
jgi:hypothetical protein